MLSSQEQRIGDDVLRFWVEEAEKPPLATPGAEGSSCDETELPIAVVAGTWITITLILFAVMSAAGRRPHDCFRLGAVAQGAAAGSAIPVRSSTISRSWWSPDHRSVYNGAEGRGEL